MPLSPSERGYAFQHAVKDHFIELGFIAQEEHPVTRTDICISHSPLDIAVECKHLKDGVTLKQAERFNQRLKQWQQMGRPCLGIMVATYFQAKAEAYCHQHNILCLTETQLDDALARQRGPKLETMFPASQITLNFLRALRGLLKDWVPHLYGDLVNKESMFLSALVSQGFIVNQETMGESLNLTYSDEGIKFFRQCKSLYDLLLHGIEHPFSSEEQIAKSMVDIHKAWQENLLTVYDKILLSGLSILEEADDELILSKFARTLQSVLGASPSMPHPAPNL